MGIVLVSCRNKEQNFMVLNYNKKKIYHVPEPSCLWSVFYFPDEKVFFWRMKQKTVWSEITINKSAAYYSAVKKENPEILSAECAGFPTLSHSFFYWFILCIHAPGRHIPVANKIISMLDIHLGKKGTDQC